MADPFTIGVLIATTLASVHQAKQAQEEQEEAQDIQTGQEQIRQTRMKRKQVREARGARARAVQAATNTGISGSSTEEGAISDVGSQLASNLAFLSGEENAATETSSRLKSAAGFSMNAKNIQSGGKLFNTLNAAGAFKPEPQAEAVVGSTAKVKNLSAPAPTPTPAGGQLFPKGSPLIDSMQPSTVFNPAQKGIG